MKPGISKTNGDVTLFLRVNLTTRRFSEATGVRVEKELQEKEKRVASSL